MLHSGVGVAGPEIGSSDSILHAANRIAMPETRKAAIRRKPALEEPVLAVVSKNFAGRRSLAGNKEPRASRTRISRARPGAHNASAHNPIPGKGLRRFA